MNSCSASTSDSAGSSSSAVCDRFIAPRLSGLFIIPSQFYVLTGLRWRVLSRVFPCVPVGRGLGLRSPEGVLGRMASAAHSPGWRSVLAVGWQLSRSCRTCLGLLAAWRPGSQRALPKNECSTGPIRASSPRNSELPETRSCHVLLVTRGPKTSLISRGIRLQLPESRTSTNLQPS